MAGWEEKPSGYPSSRSKLSAFRGAAILAVVGTIGGIYFGVGLGSSADTIGGAIGGAIIGAVIGGVAGSSSGAVLGAVLGAILGAWMGHTDPGLTSSTFTELIPHDISDYTSIPPVFPTSSLDLTGTWTKDWAQRQADKDKEPK